jgi:hypothetical protein
MLTKLLFVLGTHYIADFPLQNDFVAQNKGKKWYLLFAHGTINAFCFGMLLQFYGAYADWKVIVVLITHMLIDKWKISQPKDEAHWNLIYYDQFLHIAINIILLLN